MSRRYDCLWEVDFLPTRTEVAVYNRDDKKVIYQDLSADINNDVTTVEIFIQGIGINIFNFEVFEHKLSTIYSGKGSLSEIFYKQSVRDIV
jgi:hypothetical protein